MEKKKTNDLNNVQDILSLTPLQEGMLFHYLHQPDSDYYFEQLSLNLRGTIEPQLVREAWNQVSAANEMLRTFFKWKKIPRPVQIVCKTYETPMRFFDLSDLPETEKVQRVKEITDHDRLEKVDISVEPFRVTLLRLSASESLMIISNHHIIYDGWSNGIILKEFLQAYNDLFNHAGLTNVEVSLLAQDLVAELRGKSGPKSPFKAYIKWLQTQDQAWHEEYWRDYLEGFESKTLLPQHSTARRQMNNLDDARNVSDSSNSNDGKSSQGSRRQHFLLDTHMTQKLNRVAMDCRVTPATLFYTAWGVLLQKYNLTDDVIFGTTVSGRNVPIPGIEEMVGLFINTIPLRVKTSADESIASYLQRLDRILKVRTEHEHLPLVEIKGCSALNSTEALFDSIVVIENYPLDNEVNSVSQGVQVESYSMVESTNFDLTLALELGEEVKGQLVFNALKFTAADILILIEHYQNILTYILHHSAEKCTAIDMLSEAEKEVVLQRFNDRQLDYPEKPVHYACAEWAAKTPDAIAVKYMEEELTYAELNLRAKCVARCLQKKGLRTNQPVGIMAERSLELIIGILGIMQAGAAYLPINPNYPVERIRYMLEDSGAQYLLTQHELIAKASFAGEIIDLADGTIYEPLKGEMKRADYPGSLAASVEDAAQGVSSDVSLASLAYIIYTSGSTGKPKGVMVPHRALNNFLYNMYSNFGTQVGLGDRCLSLTNISFDVSVCEIFLPLVFGATLVLFNNDPVLDIRKLAGAIVEEDITFAYIPPTILGEVHQLLQRLTENCLAPLKLNKLLVGVEPIRDYVLADYLELQPGMQILNGYGPTEATICATFYQYGQIPPTGHNVPIGKPLANTQIYILDHNLQSLPVGIAGELCIAGDGLADGYLNQPELTDAKFVAHPFKPGARMYRTGDKARWLVDGNIEFVGRIDQQVKIRGFRIEPGEIENQLLQHPALQEACVIMRDDRANAAKYLCAYYTSANAVTGGELRDHLAETLPEYMIPSFFIQVDSFPLTANGKIDRKAFKAPEGQIALRSEYIAPRNALEERLALLWQEVLGVERIGSKDNFFELGGHSLKATSLVGRIYREMDIEIPLDVIFKNPTIEQFGRYIENAKNVEEAQSTELANTPKAIHASESAEKPNFSAINPAPVKEYYETSSAQKRIYMLQQMDLESTGYNMPAAFTVAGALDLREIEGIFRELVQRHESFRTSFELSDEQIVQRVHATLELDVQFVDYSEVLYEVAMATVEPLNKASQVDWQSLTTVVEDFVQPFSLQEAPLFRVAIVKLAEDQHLLLLDMHHIISDGLSMAILMDDFRKMYEGQELPSLRIQYKDFAEWQNRRLLSETMEQHATYWLERFSGEIPTLELPYDFRRPSNLSSVGDTVHLRLDRNLTLRLQSIAEETGSTLFMMLLAGMNILLARYSGQEDIIIGSPIAGRPHADVESVPGMFVNTLAMRNQPVGTRSFREFLQEVRENALQAYAHQDYQFEELVERLDLARDVSRNPLFDVVFAMQNLALVPLNVGELHLIPCQLNTRLAKFDLTVMASELEEEIQLAIEYKVNLFQRSTVERMSSHLQNILQEIALNPQLSISDIVMLTAPEQDLLLYEFNDTRTDYPAEKTIQQLFAAQVERTPEKTAVVFADQRLSYRELDQRSSLLANRLRAKGVQRETLVGIIAQRSLEMVIGILAIIKAGGAYLPIDLEYPAARVRYMLEDCAVKVLLTQGEWKQDVHFTGEIIDLLDAGLDRETPWGASSECENDDSTRLDLHSHTNYSNSADADSTPTSLAYVIYTSGSTGQPKGVMVEQRSIVRLVQNTNYIDFAVNGGLLQTGTLAFDASTFEIWGTLLNGMELHLADRDFILDIDHMEKYLLEENIAAMFLTTSLFNLFADTRPGMFKKLNYLLTGGEAISSRHIAQVRVECPDLKLANIYGPTENTTFSTFHFIEPGETEHIPIGKPIANSTAYIFDKYGNLCPVGVPGELCVGGAGVARGYLHNPQLTQDKFIEHPYIPGERLYRTGDLAKWRADGNIDFLGRIDQQVKIRGFRIELEEIENYLLKHEAIKEAVVIDHVGENGIKYLAAYVVSVETLVVSEVRTFLTEHLPEYMIPSYFIELESMPLTTNGKINRKALPEPDGQISLSVQYEAPRNAMEEQLTELWATVLGVLQVGINDNFFELGGHSLKATLLTGKIHKAFDVEVPLSQIFKTPTIKGISAYLQAAFKTAYSAIEPMAEKEYYATSSAQKRLYLLQQYDLQSTGYNIWNALEVWGKLDVARVERALHELIRRHEALRTSFRALDERIIQIIHQEFAFQLEYLKGDAETAMAGFIRAFDLSKAPLLRVGVLPVGVEHSILVFDLHHIISDGTSMAILINEFTSLYEGRSLEPLRIQYKDFAGWQNVFLQSDLVQKAEAYWLNRFADGAPVLNLPTDYVRPAVQSFAGDRLSLTLEATLVNALQAMAQKTGSTLYMVLLSAINILLAKYSGQEDIVIGSPIAGRPHPDLTGVVGMFVNTLAMRNYPAGQKTYREFLAEVRANALAAFENQDYQFEELVDKLHLTRDLSRNPLFDVMFVLQNMEQGNLTLEDLKLAPCLLDNKTAKFDLTLLATECDGTLALEFEYSVNLFKEGTIERFITHFENILKAITTDSGVKLKEIELLTSVEKTQLLHEFNATYADYPRTKTIHELFEEAARKVPENIAIESTGSMLTYSELNAHANRLARILQKQGVKADSIVGILMDRSPEMVISVLAVLKAGGAYLPIAPEYPGERITYLLDDSQTQVLLTQSEHMAKINFPGLVLEIKVDESLSVAGQGLTQSEINLASTAENLMSEVSANNLAYVIYTSGSTGKPKGVLVRHQSVLNILTNLQQVYPLTVDCTYLLKTAFTFDVSVTELFGWFMGQGRLALLPSGGEKDVQTIVQAIEHYQVTHVNFVPSMLSVFLEGIAGLSKDKLQSLQYVLVAGEAFPKELLLRCRAKLPGVKVENIYGPTETTIYVTRYSTENLTDETLVPIGKPMNNVQAYIVNKYNQLLPVGVVGELCIGGECLAEGYLNRPELTAERFPENPFTPGEKMYRTGDLARWTLDGNIEYLGRIDHQVKIRGFRIELGEIENQLLNYTPVKEAVVIDREDQDGQKYLCAYIVAEREVTVRELREALLHNLPEYMVPGYFIQLAKMPLNANGKVERKALPAPEGKVHRSGEYVAPRNAIETRLVELWQEILNLERVGVNDSFFELGGHSLKAATLTARVHKAFNVELPLSEFFRRPTVQALAEFIAGAEENAYASIQPIREQEYYPTSAAQRRLFIQNQFEGIGVSYNMPGAVLVQGELDEEKLIEVFQKLVDRHETLRTSFALVEGEVMQQVKKQVNFALSFSQMETSAELTMPAKLLQNFLSPFDLSKAPLLRIELVRIDDTQHLLLFDMHHIISDGVSMDNLIREFATLYQGSDLPELRIQYKDFASWQNEFTKTEAMERKKQFWLDTFQGELPILNLPTDYPRPALQSYAGRTLNFEIDVDLKASLQKLAAETGTTSYMLFLAAFYVLLAKYSGQEDIIVGSPVAGRRHADLHNIIGMFVNMIALRNAPCSSKTFKEFLHEVRDNTLRAFDHQEMQFEELVENLNLRRDLSRNPLFDVVFSWQDASRHSLIEADGIKLIPCTLENNVAKYDITVEVIAESERIWFGLEYCTELFTEERMERLAAHYINILQEITANPELSLAQLNILSATEKKQILETFNATKLEFPENQTIHELFSMQAIHTPEQIAVVFQHEALTYRELDTRTNQLAHRLRLMGVQPDEVIALMAERSIDMLIGILGVLKAGGAYLPVDPEYPIERITYMLQDSAARIILTQRDYTGLFESVQNTQGTCTYAAIPEQRGTVEFEGTILDLNDPALFSGDVPELANISTPDNLAYVMYTSGSTGQPKGVMIEHRGVVSLAAYYNAMFKLDQGKRILHMSNVSFDTSVVEIFPPLIYGATVYIIRKELALDRERFMQFIEENQINFAQFVPMTLQEILGASARVASLETVIVGSDKLDDMLKDHILSLGYHLTNHYGPTEGTVDSIVAICAKGKSTIGKPIANTQAYIVNKDLQLAPVGVPGELCISGVGLARGYLNHPDLTAERFISNPWVSGERMYRTGDLASWQPDGNITFLGRTDNQVKIRGYRIELGEIELHLLRYPGVTGAVVIDRRDAHGAKYLAAYLVSDRPVEAPELRIYLGKELPDYMIPSYFVQLERIPLTHNGKVDRRALPEPEMGRANGGEYVAPVDELEEKLVELWEEVLGGERISTRDNFFDLGGHSMKAMNLVSKIQRDVHVEVPFNTIFKNPTIQALANYIRQAEHKNYSAIKPVEERAYYPLSSAQLRLFIQWQMAPESKAYNMPSAQILEGELDKDRLEKAILDLTRRHEALRTSFDLINGEPVQRIEPEVEVKIAHLTTDESRLNDVIKEFIRPFDLAKAPLFRSALVKFAPEKHLLLLDMHHIISDGVSQTILTNDFANLYAGIELAPLQVQYKDFAIWHNALMTSEAMQRSGEYLLNQLTDFVYTEIPVGKAASRGSNRGQTMRVELNESLTRRINSFCQMNAMTKFAFILGVFKLILMRTLKQDDLTIGLPVAGRGHAELEKMIGVFVNVLLKRTKLAKDKTFREYLLAFNNDLVTVQGYQDYPYESLYAQVKERWNFRQNSLFSIFFNFMPYQAGEELKLAGVTIRPYSQQEIETKYPFVLYVNEEKDAITLFAIFDSSLDEQLIDVMMNSFPVVIETVLNQEEIALKHIPLVGENDIDPFASDMEMEFDNEDFF